MSSIFSGLLNSGLSFAVRKDYPLLANAFLFFGADVSVTDAEKNTFLHLCSSVDMAKVLTKYKANVNAVNLAGETPLHTSIRRKLFSLSEFLIADLADISVPIRTTGDTALHLAIAGIANESDITPSLINLIITLHTDDKETMNNAGKTPRDLLVEYGAKYLDSSNHVPRDISHSILVRLLFGENNFNAFVKLCEEKHRSQQPNIAHNIPLHSTFHNCRDLATAERLNATEMDIDAYDPVTGYTPLIAVMRSDLPYSEKFQLLRRYIDFGADVNKPELNTLKTPLHIAETPDIVKMLLANDALPNKTDREGNTALHWAISVPGTHKPKDHNIVQQLVANGAALDIPNAAGKTPVDLLIDYAHSTLKVNHILKLVANALFGSNGLETLNDKIAQKHSQTQNQEGPPLMTGFGIHQTVTGTSTSFDFRLRASAIGENSNSNSSEYRPNLT